MADYVGMTPTVVIGIGGTGKEILIKIRRMIVESYGSLDALPIVSFLHIDTEQNAKVSEAQNVLKQNIALRPSEQVWAKVENAKAMLNQLSSYNYLAEWFPSQLRGTDSILAGAGQIRSLGKFAFSVNYQTIKNSFSNALGRIVGHEKLLLDKLGLQLDKGVNIFIVCSLSGGTGSGMVLDLAYNLRDWVPPSAMPQTSAYLVLPGAFSGLGDRVIANAYAALMELNHYSRNDTRFECQYSSNASDRITSQSSQDVPFNFCYLVGNSNDKVNGDTDPRRWSDYFQKMWDNLNHLKAQKRQELRQIVHQMIADRFRGPKFVRQFLEVLLEVFNNYRSQFDQERQKTFLPKEQSAANALQVLLKQIDNHVKQFNPLNKKTVIEEDFNGIMQAVQSIYTSKVEVKSRTLGVLLLDAMKEEINSLIIDLTAFDKILETLETQLIEREQTYIGETGTLTVNGILLYNAKDVDQVFNQVLEGKIETIFQTVSQDILDDLGIHLFDLYSFDTLKIKDLFERLLNRSVDEFIDKSQLQVSTARKFLEQYPTLEQQEAQIKTTFEKSEAFLRFSQEQVNLGWENKIEKRQTLIGIQGGNKPTDVAVAAILPQIRKSSTLTDKDIRPLNDPHHIFFVQEVGAFPLRLIEGMEKMRVIYRTISQSDKNPLHTHQDYRQFEDIMPSSQEEVQVKQNLLLAKALGLIIQHENKVTGFDEIRFSYQDKQTGIDKVQVLGENWQKAEENLLNEQNRKVRDILADSLKKIGENATTKNQKQQLYQKLISCLKQIENTFIGGKDNPDYHKAETALEEYIKQYSLMIISPSLNSSLVTESNTISATPQNNENLEKFRKLVITCCKNGNPSATELQLVEKFRQKYNISQSTFEDIIAEYTPKKDIVNAIDEYSLMYQAFLGNDNQIDLDEQAQLLELQEELGLSNEQVAKIEAESNVLNNHQN